MDAISEVLSAVRLRGAFYFRAEFSAPWGLTSPKASEIALAIAPGEPSLVIYHLLLEGTGQARLKDGPTLHLNAGDIVVCPHGQSHDLMSRNGVFNIESGHVHEKVTGRDLTPLQGGGGGEKTRFVCGFMACDPLLSKPVLEGLPDLFKVNIRSGPSGSWLESSILHLVDESASGSAGSSAMLAKLSEALFVDTLRRYVASLPEGETGWLAAARDPIVGRSLAILHSRVNHPWTNADLAKEVGTSRTALVEHFSNFLDVAPMTYLTQWRLQLAARALTSTPRGTADIASDVGYESEAAFNRAFKREYGLPPARYRREHKQSGFVRA